MKRTTAAQALRRLTVRVRDLDTDERSETSEEVWAPTDDQRKRLQLLEAVEREHPRASIRSFADDAASFLDGPRFIVAWYGPTLTRREPEELAQAELFESGPA